MSISKKKNVTRKIVCDNITIATIKKIFCRGCGKHLSSSNFGQKKNGDTYKRCSKCREYSKEYNKKYYKSHGPPANCPHGKPLSRCTECPNGGASICIHDVQKFSCRECDGNAYCIHDKYKYRCLECKGSQLCEHSKHKADCSICSPLTFLAKKVSGKVREALKGNKVNHSVEYLGCSIEEYKKYLESKFETWMTWENHGEWHIDHITPLMYKNPTQEQVIERLHYTNTQPLKAFDNISKGNRYIG